MCPLPSEIQAGKDPEATPPDDARPRRRQAQLPLRLLREELRQLLR